MGVIKDFCIRYGFPNEATEFLIKSFETLQKFKDEYRLFTQLVGQYENDINFDHKAAFELIHGLKSSTGIHPYTLDMLYLISLTPHLKSLYEKENLPSDIYDCSVLDLKWKLFECKEIYGVWGIFVSWWTIGFFTLNLFGIGRLEFNLRKFPYSMSANGLSFCEEDTYIDTHIPSSGRLVHEECEASYRRAADFFKKRYGLDKVVFGCRSWLISPNNEKILPETSNVLVFMRDYTVLETKKDPKNSNAWRIFGMMEIPENPDGLPQDTSLRRGFANWIKNGGTIDTAFGVIVYEDSKS